MSTHWYAHVRIEKDGKAAEYNDLISSVSQTSTAAEIETAVIGEIVRHSPHLNGGQVTRSNIRRLI